MSVVCLADTLLWHPQLMLRQTHNLVSKQQMALTFKRKLRLCAGNCSGGVLRELLLAQGSICYSIRAHCAMPPATAAAVVVR